MWGGIIHTSFLLLGNNMTTENDYAKLKELMEFPAKMTFKVAGINREGLAQDLIQVVTNTKNTMRRD